MDFQDIIESLIQVLEEEAQKIDEEKLRVSLPCGHGGLPVHIGDRSEEQGRV